MNKLTNSAIRILLGPLDPDKVLHEKF